MSRVVEKSIDIFGKKLHSNGVQFMCSSFPSSSKDNIAIFNYFKKFGNIQSYNHQRCPETKKSLLSGNVIYSDFEIVENITKEKKHSIPDTDISISIFPFTPKFSSLNNTLRSTYLFDGFK